MKELASNEEWKKWGEIDPLYGVASWSEKNMGGSSPWTKEEFYKLGESDWKDFRKQWERYGLNRESCLEIGCGAGRITMQLASFFNEVHALDISKKMIEYAKSNVKHPHVLFHISQGIAIPLSDQSVYSVFSAHVFQHLDTLSVARKYFVEISRVLKPGGTIMIHMPIYSWPAIPGLFSSIYSMYKSLGNIRAHIKRQLMKLGLVNPIMRGLIFPIDFFYSSLPKYDFENLEINIFITRSNKDRHPFIFARKKL
jgi:ubiquinone/menaquinone biosynthesis C-methylase UbiE